MQQTLNLKSVGSNPTGAAKKGYNMRPEELRPSLGFEDVGLLLADRSSIRSRKEVDISTKISRNVKIKYPIILSPMDTVSCVESCIALNHMGAAGILHRFMSVDEQYEKALEIKNRQLNLELTDHGPRLYVAIGLSDYEERIVKMLEGKTDFVDVFFLDVANGSSVLVEEFMNWWNNELCSKKPDLIIGNTLTKSSVSRSINLGADGVRHGIGIGSACVTSRMTGIQCPPVTALYYGWKATRNWELEQDDIHCGDEREDNTPTLLLDGGIKTPGDLVKAIAAGADAVISGSIFAGCEETPGEIVEKKEYAHGIVSNGSRSWNDSILVGTQKFKKYRGMASKGVVDDYDLWDGNSENLFVEGDERMVPYEGKSVVEVVHEYANGLKSAMSYLGYRTISELKGSLWTEETIGIKLGE